MRKRMGNLALALVLCLGLVAPAYAASNDFVIENGVLTRYNGPGGDVTVPSGITSIGKNAFIHCDGLTSVTIPNGVTSIGDAAFFDCDGLTDVTVPDSVTSIGRRAFDLTPWLENLGEFAVVNGILLKYQGSSGNVTIPNSVIRIGNEAFAGSTGVIRIPNSVTIPVSVTSIGQDAFTSCDGLTDVYYGGNETQWKCIDIDIGNDDLLSASIHYNSAVPTTPAEPTAYASTQNVLVDGKAVEFQCYALKDANGNDTNYIKLRDVAQILNGTSAQFEVTWDGTVNIVTGQSYTANGTEMSTPFSGNRTYTVPTAQTKVNGAAASLDAIILTDDAGNGYTYYKLRDLGTALGFTVDWSADKGIFIETT